MVVRLTDLADTNTVNLMLFADAFHKHKHEIPGTILAILNPQLLKSTEVPSVGDGDGSCDVLTRTLTHPPHNYPYPPSLLPHPPTSNPLRNPCPWGYR